MSDYELVDIDSVQPHPENPRRGDIEAIAESIRANGFYGGLQVQRSTGYILAGNHRWKAAKEVGMTEIPVIWEDVDDETALRILLADNRTSDLAKYDDNALLELLDGIPTLVGTGYAPDDVEQLRANMAAVTSDEVAVATAPDDATSSNADPLGFKEVMLRIRAEDLDRFSRMVQQMHDKYGSSTTSEAVLQAVTA